MSMGWIRASAPSLVAAGIVLVLPLNGCGPSKAKNAAVMPPPQATAPPLPAPKPQPPPAPPATTAEAALTKLRVHQVIEQVEADYAGGEADYRRGMLSEAKVRFDHAVDLMLSCGIDIESEPELDSEFEKIVDKVNALEMEALKQGNGFVPKEEITPAEAASDVTFAVNPNLQAKAQADLATTHSDLPLMVNEYVTSFINFFAYTQNGHNTLLHAFERAGHYRGMIQRILAEEGLPQDLIYLAVAESGFQPRAIDRRSGAGGMWQFMPRGNYGLTRNEYVDQRFDPEESTLAYARYMRFLYDQLGDWYLAMAAYDWGAGNVQRAVEKTGYADFWQLYQRHELPGETENYVPEILAAIIIANHPAQYGFDDITLDPPVLTDTVTVNYSIDLRLVSDLVGAPIDELEALNPSLLHMVTPPESSFDLHLPAGTATLFDQRIALIPEDKRNAWRYHAMAAGDTLDSVARQYHVTEAALADANQLSTGESIADLQALVIPVAPEPLARTRVYIARRGDTLITIADRFGVSLSELRRWNDISGTRVEPGRRLRVAAPVYASARGSRSRRRESAQEDGSASRRREMASTEKSGRRETGKANPADPSTSGRELTRRSETASTSHRGARTSAQPAARQASQQATQRAAQQSEHKPTYQSTHNSTTAHQSSSPQ